jgi:two-component system, cell cycle response regulator
MSWWQGGNKGRTRPAAGSRPEGARSLMEQIQLDNKSLSRTARTLVVAFRHLAVHSPYTELKKFRRALDDFDTDLKDGKAPPEQEARVTVGGLVQELLHLNKSREQLLGTLIEDISSALVQGVQEAEGSRQEMEGVINQIREATELGDLESVVATVRDHVKNLQVSVEKQRAQDEGREKALHKELGKMRSKLSKAEQKLQIDALTGVCSRRWMDEFMAERLPGVEDDHLCLVMIDLDHFKNVNDTYGHDVGDKILTAVGRCLNETVLRKSDFVARFGGEEFAVMLSDTDAPSGATVAERIRQAIAALSVDTGSGVLRFTASFGVAAARAGETAEELFQRADKALYVAKDTGRNQVHCPD